MTKPLREFTPGQRFRAPWSGATGVVIEIHRDAGRGVVKIDRPTVTVIERAGEAAVVIHGTDRHNWSLATELEEHA